MAESESSFSKIRKIDNSRQWLPASTTLLLIVLVVILVWFFRGGSIKFYASLFFGFYDLTQSTWISILLVGVAQTVIFLPFRLINAFLLPDLKDFEKELEKTKSENQYILLHEKIRQGRFSVIFYFFNFVLLALAFFSVGRVFFLDFYHHQIDSHLLYSFIPYPKYPIQGTIFKFPYLHVTQTTTLNWSTIFTIWGSIFLFFIVTRFIWVILKRLLSKNKSLLHLRINYNRLLLFGSGFITTLFLFSLYFLRHIPTSFQVVMFTADLAKQNTDFNIITALCTCFATIYSGFRHNREAAKAAQKNGIPANIVQKVFKSNMGITIRNAFFLALFAFWITRLMPCSHDLSVLSFEALYFISPFTFDLLLPKHKNKHE